MPKNIAQKQIYQSFAMVHPDGSLMCYCSEKRANWYIKRKIANWIGDKKFQLTFAPNGVGKKELAYYTQGLVNECVVCGADDSCGLNKHHVVPYVFRARFPIENKAKNHHDILPTCVDCHEKYESHAMRFKIELARKYNAVLSKKVSLAETNNKKILQAIQILHNIEEIRAGRMIDDKNYLKIPNDKIEKLKIIKDKKLETAVPDVTEHWADTIMSNFVAPSQLFEFVKMWRQHFIDYAKPKNLPNHWSVDHPLEVAGNIEKIILENKRNKLIAVT